MSANRAKGPSPSKRLPFDEVDPESVCSSGLGPLVESATSRHAPGFGRLAEPEIERPPLLRKGDNYAFWKRSAVEWLELRGMWPIPPDDGSRSHRVEQTLTRRAVEGIVSPEVHDLIGSCESAQDIFDKLDRALSGNEAAFWLTDKPAFQAKTVFRRGGDVESHINAWLVFATRAAPFRYPANSEVGFWDFLKSVECARELVPQARRVPVEARTMRAATELFRDHVIPVALHAPRLPAPTPPTQARAPASPQPGRQAPSTGTAKSAETVNKTTNICSSVHQPSIIFRAWASRAAGAEPWILDSGATHSMSPHRALFDSLTPVEGEGIRIADGSVLPVLGKGTVPVTIFINGEKHQLRMSEVRYVPGLAAQLLSTHALTAKGAKVTMTKSHAEISIKGLDGVIALRRAGPKRDGCYVLRPIDPATGKALIAFNGDSVVTWPGLHERLGHIRSDGLDAAANVHRANGGTIVGPRVFACEPCLEGKFAEPPRARIDDHPATRAGERIHMDVVGPIRPMTIYKNRFIVTIIDAYTRYAITVATPDHKAATVTPIVVNALKWFSTQTNAPVTSLRCDRAREFLDAGFKKAIAELGVSIEYTAAASPHQNGLVERFNRTLKETVRTWHISSGVAARMWQYASDMATFAYNRRPHHALDWKSPLERLTGQTPDYKEMRPFGTIGFYGDHNRLVRTGKVSAPQSLDARGRKCVLLAYEGSTKKYVVLDVTSRKIVVTSRIRWLEPAQPGQAPLAAPDASSGTNSPLAAACATAVTQESLCHASTDFSTVASATTPDGPLFSAVEHGGDGQTDTTLPPPATNLPSPCSKDRNSTKPSPSLLPDKPNCSFGCLPNTREPSPSFDDATTEESGEPSQSDESGELPRPDKSEESASYEKPEGATAEPDATTQSPALDTCYLVRKEDVFYSECPSKPTKLTAMAKALMSSTAPGPSNTEPSLRAAERSPEWDQWQAAIDREFQALVTMEAVEVIPKPDGAKLLEGLLRLKLKVKPDGSAPTFKARFVARGDLIRDLYGKTDTSSPVINWSTAMMILKTATVRDMECRVIDYSNAYLNAPLSKPVLMRIPGYANVGDPKTHCMRVTKSLYGLPESGLNWYRLLTADLARLGWRKFPHDMCAMHRKTNGNPEFLAIYVDDVAIFTPDARSMDIAAKELSSLFKVGADAAVTQYIGVRITRDRSKRTMFLDLTAKTRVFLDSIGHPAQSKRDTPLPEGWHGDTAPIPMEPSRIKIFQEQVGFILYLAGKTRPDILTAASRLGRFSHNPSESCYEALKWTLSYLNATYQHGLTVDASGPDLVAYSDANYDLLNASSRHTSGYVILMGNTPIKVVSRRQSNVSASTRDAETYAAFECARDTITARGIMLTLGWRKPRNVTLWCDNDATVKSVTGNTDHDTTRYILHKINYLRERLNRKEVIITLIPSEENLADTLTKPLNATLFTRFRSSLAVSPGIDTGEGGVLSSRLT